MTTSIFSPRYARDSVSVRFVSYPAISNRSDSRYSTWKFTGTDTRDRSADFKTPFSSSLARNVKLCNTRIFFSAAELARRGGPDMRIKKVARRNVKTRYRHVSELAPAQFGILRISLVGGIGIIDHRPDRHRGKPLAVTQNLSWRSKSFFILRLAFLTRVGAILQQSTMRFNR